MDIVTSLAIVTLAALIHASFQLSVSVLTLLSGHAIGAAASQRRVLRMTGSYVLGAGVMTVLLLTLIAYVFGIFFDTQAPLMVWAIACGLLMGVGIAVWAFYYRRDKGTTLWVPRAFARHLSARSKATKDSTEAFSLGLTAVISELMFILAPLAISALVLLQLPQPWQAFGIVIYATVSLLTLISIWVLISTGNRLTDVQRWREKNKHFLQFAAGGALIVLGCFVYVSKIVADMVGVV